MENYYFSLKSPSEGKAYPVKRLLSKFLERAKIDFKKWDLYPLYTCSFGSEDWAFEVQDFASYSLWGNSVNVKIDGVIPLHVSVSGRMTAGWDCHEGGSYPPGMAYPGDGWNDYKKTPLAKVSFWLSNPPFEVETAGHLTSEEEEWILLPTEKGEGTPESPFEIGVEKLLDLGFYNIFTEIVESFLARRMFRKV